MGWLGGCSALRSDFLFADTHLVCSNCRINHSSSFRAFDNLVWGKVERKSQQGCFPLLAVPSFIGHLRSTQKCQDTQDTEV